MELWYLISAYHLMMLYICTKFQENIQTGFRVIKRMWFVHVKFLKGHNSVNSVGSVATQFSLQNSLTFP